METNGKKMIRLILIMVWVLFIVLGYYVFHKPIDKFQAGAIGSAFLNVSIAGAITCMAGGIGRRIYHNDYLRKGELIISQAVIGFGILALAWLLIGLLGGYYRWLAWLLLISSLLVLRESVSAWIKDLLSFINEIRQVNGYSKIIRSGVLLLLLFQFIRALAPVTSWDSLMYHLEIPKQYLEMHRFGFISENYYWGQPQLSELLYTYSASFFSWESATVLNWIMAVLFLVGVFSTVNRYSTPGAVVAVASILVGETFRSTMSSGYVDAISALFGYALFVVLLSWQKNQKNKQLTWIGIFLGLTLWIKLTNIILIPLVMISLITINIKASNPWWKGSRSLLIGILVFLPWLLILWVFTGNPFYPHLFPSAEVSAIRYEFFQAQGTNPGWTAFWLPIAMTFFGLHTNFVEGKIIFATDIGPLLVGFGVIGWFTAMKEKTGNHSAIWVLAGWIFIVMGGLVSELLWQTRLYFALLLPLAILVGLGWKKVAEIEFTQIKLKNLIGSIVILVIVLTGIKDLSQLIRSQVIDVAVGTTSEENYLSRNLGAYYLAATEIEKMSAKSKTLMFWEPRGFYMPGNASTDIWLDRWYLLSSEYQSVQDLNAEWKKSGVSHLLINISGMDYEMENNSKYSDQQWLLLDQILDQLPDPEMIGSQYALYSLE